ncbi:poly(ADP-ribose) glycohydrolase, partial [Sarracenia purpurea var. burkii]
KQRSEGSVILPSASHSEAVPFDFETDRARAREKMEDREDLKSILPYLPVVIRSSKLFWPSQVVEALKA